MKLYLFRHGPAAERDPEKWPDDADRPLTENGVERTIKAARGLAWLATDVRRVITSPLVRARQTADIVRSTLEVEPAVEVLEALAPGGDHALVLRRFERMRSAGAVILVGHEPDLGCLASRLIGVARAAPHIVLKKAGACAIDFEGAVREGQGRLESCLTPRVLRRLGRS